MPDAPTDNAPELPPMPRSFRDEGYEQYISWMRGWRDSAAGRARNPALFQSEKEVIRRCYEAGYIAGRIDVHIASDTASKLYNYTPTVLREAGK